MSILIKDMEMPSGCASCDFANYLRAGEPYCRRLMRRVPAARRLPDCPIGHVPPHGRLIDADELRLVLWKRAKEFSNSEYGEGVKCGLADAREYIKIAPTVIPAEEGET